ncbi:hypothetical protein PWT90_06338 [Aphanocladium album]|nr:hypothetical protein PWT90_06338 [Aphanocladium album]
MNSFRIARAAIRARPVAMRMPVQRRGYAEAIPDKRTPDRSMRISRPNCPSTSDFRPAASERRPPMRQFPATHANYLNQTIFKSQNVVQVNIPAESGEMGVLANHVPSIEQLKPGVVEVVEENGSTKSFFLSGGFATIQPDSALSINAPEAYALEDFSADAIRSQIAEAQKVASGSGSEQDIAEAKIELEVLETLQAHVK